MADGVLPTIDRKTAAAMRTALKKGVGIRKTATKLGVRTGWLHKIETED